MRLIKRATLKDYARKHPAAESSLFGWAQMTEAADWHSIEDVRRVFPHADSAVVASGNTVTIFNIAGNRFRLVVSIKYRWGVVYVRDFLTHAEYSKDTWKKRH
ncbi:MAG: type II toxin-antitoxin system HigB family toxin [Tepidisphaeraceae bacterium]|jgi:mRNA interferase HigB